RAQADRLPADRAAGAVVVKIDGLAGASLESAQHGNVRAAAEADVEQARGVQRQAVGGDPARGRERRGMWRLQSSTSAAVAVRRQERDLAAERAVRVELGDPEVDLAAIAGIDGDCSAIITAVGGCVHRAK